MDNEISQPDKLIDYKREDSALESAWQDKQAGKKRRQVSGVREDFPRLLLVWCLWILFSWLSIRSIAHWRLREVAGGIFSPPGEPVVRWMLLMSFMGFMLIWPLYRLSQKPLETDQGKVVNHRGAKLLLDWVGMFALFQIVLWPVMHMNNSSLDQAIYLDIAIGAWSLITGFIIDWGLRFNKPSMRTLAMVLCIALVFLEPLIQVIINGLGYHIIWPLTISPLGTFADLTVVYFDFNLAPILPHIYSALGVAIGGWIITLCWRKTNV